MPIMPDSSPSHSCTFLLVNVFGLSQVHDVIFVIRIVISCEDWAPEKPPLTFLGFYLLPVLQDPNGESSWASHMENW